MPTTGIPLQLPQDSEACHSVRPPVAAVHAAGRYANLDEATAAMVSIQTTIGPDRRSKVPLH